MTDALTGPGDRRRLAGDLAGVLERAATGGPALVAVDFDGFEACKDTCEHLAGNALLIRLCADPTVAVGPGGGAYRLGGDEFCALRRP